jgi:hypothetical protein
MGEPNAALLPAAFALTGSIGSRFGYQWGQVFQGYVLLCPIFSEVNLTRGGACMMSAFISWNLIHLI